MNNFYLDDINAIINNTLGTECSDVRTSLDIITGGIDNDEECI